MGNPIRPPRSHRRRPLYLAAAFCPALLAALTVAGEPTIPAAGKAPARTYTFADVAPIVYANCAACHREGEAAPFSLLDYHDVRKHAEQVADVTARRVMPPWKADCGDDAPHFLGERRLTDGQIALLACWVEQGCPEGDPAAAPQSPQFAGGWRLGEPDLVVKMPDAFTVPADGRDIYRCFAIPLKLPAGKFIRAVEYRPGARRVVHHAVLTALPHDAVLQKFAAEPAGAGPGFATGLAAPGARLPGPLGIWAPGRDPMPLPEGYAVPWREGVDLLLQLHLHPVGKSEVEQSSVALYLTDQRPKGAVAAEVLLAKNVNIPPGDKSYKLAETLTLKRPVQVIGLFPHMHLLGRTTKAVATLPDGSIKPLLSIDDWDFNWQTYYQYAAPMVLPAGTRVDAEWTFDNSTDNPANPSNPPRRVHFGEQTTDEMGALILDVIPAAPPRAHAMTSPGGDSSP